MKNEYDVVVAGHICLDISLLIESTSQTNIEQFFLPGRLININGVAFSAGGSVANTGFGLSKLGLSVLPMANIGKDEFGTILKSVIQRETGIKFVPDENVRTSYSVVLSIPGIDRIILHDPAGNNTFNSDSIDYKQLNKAKIFHFGYPPLIRKIFINNGAELVKIFSKVKQEGVTTSLDMSLPDIDSESGKVDWYEIMEETLPFVDVFLPSIEEALFIFDQNEYLRVKKLAGVDDFVNYIDLQKVSEVGDKIIQLGAAIAVIKCGSKGVYIKTTHKERILRLGAACPKKVDDWCNKELFEETYYVADFKSALAGGDTTIAGLLSGLLKGYDIYQSLKIACMTGALCCTTYDSVSGLLPLDQIVKKTIEATKNKYDRLAEYYDYDNSKNAWGRKR